eukprot:TRINITY_DN20040_c0_g1_i1.p1 TRINITY_DN20040_c0_g1~~TRINITY_DN20040_c0_g1_i1.p1  ORF type:complete len:129 (+),score=25.00 TRINITY_DN20040_c0_g1_i1:2-388(+)
MLLYILTFLFLHIIMLFVFLLFLMIRRPPRSTLSSSSAASDVYKRQVHGNSATPLPLPFIINQSSDNTQPISKEQNVEIESILSKIFNQNSNNKEQQQQQQLQTNKDCLLYTSPSPRDRQKSRMPSSA